MEKFKNDSNAFNFVYEKELAANETVIVEMPPVTPNKRGVNDIGWQADGDVILYGTLSGQPESEEALWQEIKDNYEINKTISALKIVNCGVACKVAIRVIMC